MNIINVIIIKNLDLVLFQAQLNLEISHSDSVLLSFMLCAFLSIFPKERYSILLKTRWVPVAAGLPPSCA